MNSLKYADIAFNVVDHMYSGIYNRHNIAYHAGDLSHVINRAHTAGVNFMLCIGGNLQESIDTIELCRKYCREKISETMFATVGCHPTRTLEFENNCLLSAENACTNSIVSKEDYYLNKLSNLIKTDMDSDLPRVIAVGEIGLDYCRTNFAPIEVQKKYFIKQLQMAKNFNLPLYLHDRDSNGDFYNIMLEHFNSSLCRGVLHSFTGSQSYMKKIVDDLNLYIGINGCSLKTEEGLNVASNIPLDRLLLETDSPWCSIKSSHASFPLLNDYNPHPNADGLIEYKPKNFKQGYLVTSRNEPCHVRKVYHIVAKLRNISTDDLKAAVQKNLKTLFSF